jgi:hypothetical protein
VNKKLLLSAFLTAILIGGLVLASAMRFGTVQASNFTVDSISKPSVPEFSVRIVAYPYDVPDKTTTTIDQYTGKETTITQPGYHVENKSIEIVIKNQPFTPYSLATYTRYNHETGESYTYESTQTINIYYDIGVKGHFGNDSDWDSVGSIFSFPEGPQSNAQLDSEYTVISIKADNYPKDAVLDFHVRALIGYYIAWGRSVAILGYDFYGQEGDWSDTQTITIGASQTPTPSPAATPTPTPPNFGPTSSPSPELALTQEQLELIIGVAIAAAVIGAGLGLLIYLIKRK